jgi:hypothetical protein
MKRRHPLQHAKDMARSAEVIPVLKRNFSDDGLPIALVEVQLSQSMAAEVRALAQYKRPVPAVISPV